MLAPIDFYSRKEINGLKQVTFFKLSSFVYNRRKKRSYV